MTQLSEWRLAGGQAEIELTMSHRAAQRFSNYTNRPFFFTTLKIVCFSLIYLHLKPFEHNLKTEPKQVNQKATPVHAGTHFSPWVQISPK